MLRGGAIVALLIALTPAAQAQGEAEQRARYERGQAQQRAFVHSRFTDAGFPAIADMDAEGRHVRRMLLRDPYGLIAMPGIELERLKDGRVTLRLQYRSWTPDPVNRAWSSEPVEVDPAAWDELAALEPPLFTPPPFRYIPPEPQPPRPSSPPPVCHAWLAWFEAGRERTATWSGCGGGDRPGYRYAVRLAELAMRSKPGCEPSPGDPFFSFGNCFSMLSPLDNPALQTEVAALRKDFDEAPASTRLGEAHQALRAPGLTLGSQAWLDARAAVAGFREVHELRRDRLNRMVQLLHSTPNLSDADRSKLAYFIETWSNFLQSEERSYADLLQRLAWPEGQAVAQR